MSRWLNQVNNFLETLDGKAETVAEDVVPVVVQSVSSRAKQLLTSHNNNRQGEPPSEEDGSSYYDSEEGEEEDASEDEDEEKTNDENSSFMQVSGSDHVISEDDHGKLVTSSEEENEDEMPHQQDSVAQDKVKDEISFHLSEATVPDSLKTTEEMEQLKPIQEPVSIPAQPSSVANKPPISNKKYVQMIENIKLEQLKERQAFQQLQTRLETELDSLRKELKATNAELQQAAITVEQERKAAVAERNDLLEEQEEDLQQFKEEYEEKLRELREQLKEQRNVYEAKLAALEQEYRQEGGNLSADLLKLREREKLAQARSHELEDALTMSKFKIETLEQSLADERAKVETANERATTAERASAVLEQQLDEAQVSHSKQLQQRLARESELESTVAELSNQVANSQRQHVVMERPVLETNFQSLYETALEELEARKSETLLAQQRCNILQNELDEMSKEHSKEAQALQQLIHDLTNQLRSKIIEHESTTNVFSSDNDEGTIHELRKEVDRANEKVSSLTDQLIRQQGLAELAKSEVLALKGRLQVAVNRAEAVERQQQQQVDWETTESHLRRRVKGGRNRFGQLSTRNMRTSIGLRATASSSFQRQVGDTLDALDVWLMETGNILRHEPLSRLGFVMYLCLLHLWCFGLIAYHTIQSERTGFSELADRSRIPHLHHTNPVGPR